MFAETVSIIVPSSVLAAINSWLTPTVFFVILNAVIAAIAFTSSLANQKPQSHHDSSSTSSSAAPKVPRSPSVLQRLRSINFPVLRSPEPALKPNPDFEPDSAQNPQSLIQTASYIFRQDYLPESEAQIVSHVESVDPIVALDEKPEPIRTRFEFQAAIEEEAAERPGGLDGGSSKRDDSDAMPLTGENPARVPAKMTKSASMKAACLDSEEVDVEARRPATMKERVMTEADEEVDAKADDFINKFRQQLELQRADSILRYKGVNRRGAER
ncbi:unnamed protein product [Cuscuta campestris]|uniref:DUF4408 domain-containing protein n=2 Tax=Cuscuta sect. Cleistogrammica TaxID=1824901 RepID=A0A484M0H5_9ASTE|nr:hypothetical protein DM860_000672 [Cuscuta australis]VFQ82292.1 unnamed protein product [Cuscuta campestris]